MKTNKLREGVNIKDLLSEMPDEYADLIETAIQAEREERIRSEELLSKAISLLTDDQKLELSTWINFKYGTSVSQTNHEK